MFKKLDSEEEQQFRQWARDNYQPGDKIKETWHPVIQDECLQMCGGNMPTDTAPNKLPTLQEQADLLGATDWEYKDGYADFYNGNVFRGSVNLAYLRANS